MMTISKSCSSPGCEATSGDVAFQLHDGKPLCPDHYRQKIKCDLMNQFEAWHQGTDPPQRFKYLLGRVSHEEDWPMKGGSYLSRARIRDRGYAFEKTPCGCRFCITRHPGAFKNGYVEKKVVETWSADLQAETLTLSACRNWTDEDPDL
jgi:hypothetical protein